MAGELSNSTRISRRLALLALAACALLGCGPREYLLFGRHGAVPIQGTLEVSDVGEGERRYHLEVDGLPEPQRLDEKFNVYVVWLDNPRRGPVKLGRLTYDDLRRRGTIDARSREPTIRLFISAETEDWVSEPGPHVVVQRVFDGT
jgi:hypothetical protein